MEEVKLVRLFHTTKMKRAVQSKKPYPCSPIDPVVDDIRYIKNLSMKKELKRAGYDYLHSHREMEKQLNVPADHVIVDRKDWEEVVRFLMKNPNLVESINKDSN